MSRPSSRPVTTGRGIVVLVGIATLLAMLSRWARSDAIAADPSSTPAAAQPAQFGKAEASAFLKTYCVSCHGATNPKGNFNIEPLLAADNFRENAVAWRALVEKLVDRAMPPPEKKNERPSAT